MTASIILPIVVSNVSFIRNTIEGACVTFTVLAARLFITPTRFKFSFTFSVYVKLQQGSLFFLWISFEFLYAAFQSRESSALSSSGNNESVSSLWKTHGLNFVEFTEEKLIK